MTAIVRLLMVGCGPSVPLDCIYLQEILSAVKADEVPDMSLPPVDLQRCRDREEKAIRVRAFALSSWPSVAVSDIALDKQDFRAGSL